MIAETNRAPHAARLLRNLILVPILAPVLILVCLLGRAAPAAAMDIQRVVSPGGIEAWLVRDTKIPVVAIEFYFRGGAAQDPPGKDGTANMMASLLDEGAGPYDSQAFQRRLADNAVGLGFSAQVDGISGGIKTLVETEDEAFELARLALTEPRFDGAAVDRVRTAILTGIRRDQGDPNFLLRRTFYDTAYPGHAYGRRAQGSPESVTAITVEDLRADLRDLLARDVLLVAATGDITPERFGKALDHIFGGLPAKAALQPIPDAAPQGTGQTIIVQRTQPQSLILAGQPGIKRDDPDWFPATVMNYVLGGGSFSSRLMNEIREKRGLTYGVSSFLLPFEHTGLVMASTSTINDKAGIVVDLLRSEWRRMAEGGITEQELKDAKTFLTGSFPLQFTSTEAIAEVLLVVQRDHLGIDYLDRRSALIDAVTVEDVNRVAHRLLDPAKLLTVVVGQPQGIAATRTVGDGRG